MDIKFIRYKGRQFKNQVINMAKSKLIYALIGILIISVLINVYQFTSSTQKDDLAIKQ